MLRPGGSEVKQHVPGGIGEQIAIEEARAQLALADDPAHQTRIGQRRARRAHQPVALVRRSRKGLGRALETEQSLVRRACLRRGSTKPLEPLGDLGDLLGQAQQGQPVLLGQVPHAQVRRAGQRPAQRHDPLRPARIDQDLRARLVKAAKHVLQRLNRGRNHQLRARMGRAHVQPGERSQHFGPDLRTIEQHDIAQRAHLALDQRLDPAGLRHTEPRRFGIVAQLGAQVRPIGKDRQRQRQGGAIVGGGGIGQIGGEIGLGHGVRLPFL